MTLKKRVGNVRVLRHEVDHLGLVYCPYQILIYAQQIIRTVC
jgi:hypothetical protein